METPQILQLASLLTLPQLQAAEVLSLRAAGTRRRDLARALGVAEDDARLAAVLRALFESGLAWPDPDDDAWIRTVALHEVIANSYGFGRVAAARHRRGGRALLADRRGHERPDRHRRRPRGAVGGVRQLA
ncbi:hypothetical protein [Dactylosporangium sp. NPDC051484]|uniref:hypothetical protein n=1 Tax=Dactylosporangium sp. NPDC051484 TaxID=3154942 RepID=UPI00344BBE4A